MPDWIIVLIVLLIIGIVLDGLRRVRINRKESIRLSRRAHLADKELESLDDNVEIHASEFPSGGARKIHSSNKEEADTSSHTLTFDEPVPMLMEPVEQDDEALNTKGDQSRPSSSVSQTVQPDEAKKAAAQSSLGILADGPDDFYSPKADVDTIQETSNDEPQLGSLTDLDSIDDISASTVKPDEDTQNNKPRSDNPLNFKNYKPKLSQRVKEKPEPEPVEKELEEVVIVNVMSKNGTFFEGQQLLQAFVDNNLKFGERDIFHRHKQANGDGTVLFSIANMVVPGTFDLVSIDSFVTPGVSMFMTLPVDEESLVAFNIMIDTAKNLANSLDGELKDENRSVMTAQTIEHAKEKVLEYERKRQLRHR